MDQVQLFYSAIQKNEALDRALLIGDMRGAFHADSKKLKPYVQSLEKAAN
jgi:hypothetical protein